MGAMTKKILSIIPARGGSKGLPRKNILELSGKPLIAWTIEESIKSRYINKTVVSSEDEEILEVSKKYGAETIKRPYEIATDTATSESVIIHTLEYLNSLGEVFDIVILLQPTSPLRNKKHIDEAIDIMLNDDVDTVISVMRIDNKILKSFTMTKEGYLDTISSNKYPFMRRQDLPNTYTSNGAIYISKVEYILKNKIFFSKKTIGYEMNTLDSIDIDNVNDMEKAARLLSKR